MASVQFSNDIVSVRRSLAGSSVAPHLVVIRRAGFCALAPGARVPALARRLHAAYCWFTLAATSTYVLQHLICAYQERRDTARVSRVLYVMFSFCTCVSKQVAFRLRQPRVDRLIATLDEELFNQRGAGHERLLRLTARRALALMRTFYCCGVSTVSMWVLYPVVERLQGRPYELSFWTIVDYTKPSMFALVVAHSAYMTALLSMGNTTMDVFIGTLLYQCTTQLRILRMNFESLTERAKKISEETGEKYEAMLNKLLVQCILHFQKIAEQAEEVVAVFGGSVLVQFAVGGWMMCTAAYTLVSDEQITYLMVEVRSMEFLGSVFFIICIVIELYIYCYFGNEVTLESERVVEAIYCTGWVGAPLRFQRALVLVMERAKRPLRPTAVGLIPLSLDTYVRILKSTYSLFSVLRQTK